MFWKNKIADCADRRKPLGFQMHVTNDMERYRADTFWTKEPETLAWVDGFKPDSIFLDIGANIGVYSLYAASTKPNLHVYAFEPMLENFTRLVDNVLLNHLRNVTPINAGVGRHQALARFFVKNTGIGESGSQLNAPVDEHGALMSPEIERKVITVTFDSFVAMIPNKRPVYLKIDVDGREMDIIQGIKKHAPCLESVLVEINTKQVTIGDVAQIMKGYGLIPDARINHMKPHSSQRRGGNPVNVVFTRPY